MSDAPTLEPTVGTPSERDLIARELRLGHIDFLNMYPMHWALGIEPTLAGVPTDINRRLVEGEVDVACISSIEYARNADQLMLLPSMCVSAEGAVGSIFAITNVPFEQVTDVWVTPQTATSVVLLQVLFQLRGTKPTLHLLEEDPAAVLAAGDRRAVLLIGDDALKARGAEQLSKYAFVDLGERWLGETGPPMVFAVWAVRREAVERSPEAAATLDRLLVESVNRFRGSDVSIAQASERYGIDEHATRSYLDRLSYDFGANERKGMIRFLRMASERQLLGAVPQPKFVEVRLEVADDEHAEAFQTAVSSRDPDVVRGAYLKAVGSSRALDETPEDDAHVDRCLELEALGRERDVDDVLNRALDGERIDVVDALAMLQSDRLMDIGQVAHALRLERTPSDAVTFIVDRNINYTNYCLTDCGFCAFYRRPGDESGEGYLQTIESLLEKIGETIELGGTAALMQGGHNPDLGIEWYLETFRTIKATYPTFHLHALSPPEIQHIARRSKLSVGDTLAQLRDAGMDSLPGGGGEVLVDRVRRVMAPKKTKTDDWLGVMRVAQRMGMSTSATMMYGHIELLAERALHLEAIRELQDETGGFRSFTSWTFQPGGTPLAQVIEAGVAPYQRHLPPPPTPFTYLLTQAVGRIFLDNVDNVQSSWVTQGLKVGQAALFFGANDMGSIMIEENVVSSAGTTYRATTEDFVHAITAAGFTPVQRDTLYRTVTTY
ncbi:MAG: dehypoxanthine futalosine cyclase [Thermoleophilia bacterium]|nr:dehypoxanthine futalosine cyclase [Thermoleophilia bacterium]